jgi:DNA-binding MarR family transcriptional regulator
MNDDYFEVISFIERVHRQFLDVVKLELDKLRVREVNNVQAWLLFNMGEGDVSVGELISRGYYLGSNVSYNVKKLSDSRYLSHQRSAHDRRSTRVRLTPKGRALRNRLIDMLNRHVEMLSQTQIKDTDLKRAAVTLQQFERFWTGRASPLVYPEARHSPDARNSAAVAINRSTSLS